MILVLSLVLGVVPLFGVVWIFVSGMIVLSAVFNHNGRAVHDADPADAVRMFPVECILGNARPRNARQEEGKRTHEGTYGKSELSDGNPRYNFDTASTGPFRGSGIARIYALVARDRALLPATHARGRGAWRLPWCSGW